MGKLMNLSRTAVTVEQSDKLMKARCRLMTREPWYGHIAMSMVWIPSQMPWLAEERRTMGVRIVNGGEIQCIYYPPFVEKLSIRELFAVIQHEIEHIVRVHCVRVGGREPDAWNIAADMTVNGTKSHPRIGYHEANTNEIIVPLKGQIVWIPEDWPKDGTSEAYYDMLEKRQKEHGKVCPNCRRPTKGNKPGAGGGKGKKGKNGDDDDDGSGNGNAPPKPGQGQTGQGGTCPTCGQEDTGEYSYGGVHGKAIDDHSVWNQSDVSEDEARQIVKDVVEQATQKCQGSVPGHLEDAIKELQKPVVRWRELLRHYLGKHVGNQRKTYSRRDRRHDWFGMPGISHHAAATANVIVDTSGSVGRKELEQFFAEIDTIAGRAKVRVLQWDHAFQGFNEYRRGDWKKFKIHGRGGTDMAAPVKWLVENKLIADVQVMLTDGYCNWHEECAFPMITCITTPEGTTDGPGWGHEVRLKANS
jgi:predicted metal-dependent peptidase